MTLAVDASVGGVSANAFADVVTVQAIMDGTPNAGAWQDAALADRNISVVYATSQLNVLAYQGVKSTVEQALAWPRGGVLDPDYGNGSDAFTGYVINPGGEFGAYLSMTEIPRRIVRATAMLALEILRAGTSDVWGVDSTVNVASKSIGGAVTTTYIDRRLRRLGLRQFPNVWREVGPLVLAAKPLTVERA